ncbi:C-C motif chemokine 26-like [Clupea harengus]|uniref:C-C motif chemokine 26-like n=1 Tax=Clupea harengus TaxID=7950 RepID=A0A6P8EYW0_CLUHA|nr:C-C motif chemokine 26-like [Clupea harengus]
MAKITVSLCALLGLLLVLASEGETKLGTQSRACCAQFIKVPLPLERIRGFIEERQGICRLKAVKFITVKGKVVCANPNDQWVKDAKEFIRTPTVAP